MGNNLMRIFREEVEREENESGDRLSEFVLLKLLYRSFLKIAYRSLGLLLAVNLFVFVIELLDKLNSDDDGDDGPYEDHVT